MVGCIIQTIYFVISFTKQNTKFQINCLPSHLHLFVITFAFTYRIDYIWSEIKIYMVRCVHGHWDNWL